MGRRVRRAGEFCWINMLTGRPEDARVFYAELLGWSYREMPGMGHLILVGGSDVGGLFDVNGPNTPRDTVPEIGGMVKVDNVDQTCARLEQLGGKTKTAFDIGDRLRMAVCFDADGAQFDLWESGTQQGTDVDSSLHGAPSWFEVVTHDLAKTGRFYSDLFGWSAESQGVDYISFTQGADYVAGALQITPDVGPMKPHWGVYFTVDDADEAARKAKGLGATLFSEVRDIPGIGRFCGITSPQGVPFYAIKYEPRQS